MIHFLFLSFSCFYSLGTKYLQKNVIQLLFIYLTFISFFPLGLSTSKELLTVFSIPISCLCILILILHSSSFFSVKEFYHHFLYLSYFANPSYSLWKNSSSDWVMAQVIIHWLILSTCAILAIPLGLVLLQSSLPNHLILVYLLLFTWIWNQLHLFIISSSITFGIEGSHFLSILITLPFSIPFYLWILDSCQQIELNSFLSLESFGLLVISICYLFLSPRLVSFFLRDS